MHRPPKHLYVVTSNQMSGCADDLVFGDIRSTLADAKRLALWRNEHRQDGVRGWRVLVYRYKCTGRRVAKERNDA